MMSKTCLRLIAAALTLPLLVLGGCASAKPARFYALQPLSVSEGGARAATIPDGMEIGVGPVELQEYLNRPQIVTRQSPNRLELAEFDRWIEPLKKSLPRILAENLSALLGTERVAVFPWKNSTKIDYQVVVTVIRFDGEPGVNAMLVARWTILERESRATLLSRKSEIAEPVDAEGYEALVSAKSRALATLSREIAAELRTLSQDASD